MAYSSCIPDPEISAYPFPPFATALPDLYRDLGNLSEAFTPSPILRRFLEEKRSKDQESNRNNTVREVEGASVSLQNAAKIDDKAYVNILVELPEIIFIPTKLEPSFTDKDAQKNAWPPIKRRDTEPRSNNQNQPAKRQCVDRGVVVNTISPRKPPGDHKNYRVITLSNGLRAVLIHNEERCRCVPGRRDVGRSEGNTFMECCSEDQKLMERQKYLPMKCPITPVCMQKFANSLEKWFPVSDQESETKENGTAPKPTMEEVYKGGSTENKGGSGDCPKHSKVCPPAMMAVVVNVGVCDDPDACLGLAHFTEHMVHYGSRKFPQEDSYINFALNHAYGFNAFTENHTTTYYGIMPDDKLAKGIDMMSSMMDDPSFVEDMTIREINSVDAEFQLKRHFDVLRRWFLFQTALKTDHPLNKFGFGNEETLLKSKELIHKRLRELHDKYYKAGAMTVGVESSTLSLDEQEDLVIKHFGNIPKGTRKTLKDTVIPPAEKSVAGSFYNWFYVLQGLSSFSDLWVAWPIPSALLNERDHKTLTMVCAMLEDTSEGSLSHYLAKEGLIWLMLVPSPVDESLMGNKYTGFIAMEILLTEKGVQNTTRILEAIYAFIDALRHVPESKMKVIFNELKLDAQRQLKSGSQAPPDPSHLKRPTETAMELAKSLQYSDPENILMNPLREWQKATYSHKDVSKVFEQLKQSNMIVIQIIPRQIKLRDFVKNGKIFLAPYTDAEYCVGNRMPNFLDNKARYTFTGLKSNIFMEGVSEVPPCCGEINGQPIEMPSCDPMKVLRAEHLGNTSENYRVECNLNFFSPTVTTNPRNYALSLLWSASTMLALMPEYGKAAQAGLKFCATPHNLGITISAAGFPEKLFQALEKVTDQMFSKPITETEFTLAQAALKTLYDLLFANNMQYITQDLVHNMTCNPFSEVLMDAINYIKSSTYVDVNNFTVWFKRQAVAVVVVKGNVEPQEAGAKIDEILNRQDYYPYLTNFAWFHSRPGSCSPSVSPLPLGEKRVRIQSDVSTSYTTTVNNFYCVGKYSDDEFLLWHSALYFFRAKTFYELRTRKQLGYDVHPYFPKPEPGKPIMLGIGITATAKKFTACELDNAIDSFMVAYGKYLEAIPDSEFAAVKAFRGQTNQLTVAHVSDWYQSHFGDMFASKERNRYHYLGMSKISIQLIGNESKGCNNCPICGSISGWKKGDMWNNFNFAEGRGPDNTFVTNPKSIGGS
ncbi:unnamed protein product [Orchesella dallaii]|uniref:Nardilysin n=1 Tax=Orchesella dallaii TaxID=48710 RepID=A0ABP1QRX5_9HEXA